MGNLQYLSVFIVVLLTNCEAKQKHVSHSESLNRKYIKHKWMAKLEDSRLLSSISIPGTHRSSKNLKTSKPRFQAWVLQNQMDAGVRFFELHVSTNNIKYGGSEGVEESETLSYFLKTLLTFLAKQDTETVLLKLIPDEGAVAQVTEKLNRKKSDLWMDERIPTLGQVRGKIVLIQSSTLKLGLPIQMTELDGDLNAKEMQMRKNIKLASENCDHDMRLSYTGAKGESEDPLTIAKALNKPVDDYLLDLKGDHTRPHCVGVIAMDFPGPKVIETIINFNGKLGEGSNVDNDPGKGDVALPEPQPESVSQHPPKADEPPTNAPSENPTPKADEPPTDAPPKADEPPTDAPPKADEPPTDAPPKADEPPTDAPPKADEPPTDAPPKADEPPTDAPPKADEPPTDAPPKADEPQTHPPIVEEKPKRRKVKIKCRKKHPKRQPSPLLVD